ncbi:PREDICTED: uncharacterized protein LOC109129227 [Camelina sativa]|uniref:Uncharacterized protein LOC109129227 n=1 Tax=Camelina sativa TaxID=90675 RepID=A0ABM1R0I8_CAMSA|nr:PREDICTED: uncharacterized protein LOC109129227 [Camelina sativa]
MDLAIWVEEMSGYTDKGAVLQDTHNRASAQVSAYLGENAELMSLTLLQEDSQLLGNELSKVKESRDIEPQGTKSKSLRFWGSISGQRLLVEVDSGASQNYISEEFAVRIRLPKRVTKPRSVRLGHGQLIVSKSTCQGVSLLLQGVEISEDFLTLYLTRTEVDLILGYPWLSKLGETCVNWQDYTFSFLNNQDWITLCEKDEKLKLSTPRMKIKSEVERRCKTAYYLADKIAPNGGIKSMSGVGTEYPKEEHKTFKKGEEVSLLKVGQNNVSELLGINEEEATRDWNKINVVGNDELSGAILGLEKLLMFFTSEVSHSPRPPDILGGERLVSENSKAIIGDQSLENPVEEVLLFPIKSRLFTLGEENVLIVAVSTKLQAIVYKCCNLMEKIVSRLIMLPGNHSTREVPAGEGKSKQSLFIKKEFIGSLCSKTSGAGGDAQAQEIKAMNNFKMFQFQPP